MSEDHIISRLRALRKGVDDAIADLEAGRFRPCTREEEEEHTRTYGAGAMTLGDFVITNRKATPRASAPQPASFDPTTHVDGPLP